VAPFVVKVIGWKVTAEVQFALSTSLRNKHSKSAGVDGQPEALPQVMQRSRR
jgi:hypothetical protein